MLVLINLAGALGLFLYGMKVMSDALMQLAGSGLRTALARLTANRFKGLATGMLITGLIQSSSATTVMVVSFVNAGLLGLRAAIPVVMGANIGTTFTGWIIALVGFGVSLAQMAIPLVGLGFLLASRPARRQREAGLFLIGFALLFLGLDFMKDAVPDLSQNPAVFDFLRDVAGLGFGSTLIFLAIGTLMTVVLQSSSATMAITLIAASQGWLSFPAAAAIILGENVGTTITANLAALVANTNARRIALAHLAINLIGVGWALALLSPLLWGVDQLATVLAGLSPLAVASAMPVGLALFHTVFNVVNAALLLGFVDRIERLVTRAIAERPDEAVELTRPRFLEEAALRYPETAIAALEAESRRLFEEAVFEVVAHGMAVHRTQIRSDEDPLAIARSTHEMMEIDIRAFFERRIQPLYEALTAFSARARERLPLSPAQTERLLEIRHANRDLLNLVKNVGVLNNGLQRFAAIPNASYHNEMDAMRAALITLLRRLFALCAKRDPSPVAGEFDALRATAEQLDARILTEVDRLIRGEEITPAMGAQLISAGSLTRQLTGDLIKTARRLYGPVASLPDTARRDVLETVRDAPAAVSPRPSPPCSRGFGAPAGGATAGARQLLRVRRTASCQPA